MNRSEILYRRKQEAYWLDGLKVTTKNVQVLLSPISRMRQKYRKL